MKKNKVLLVLSGILSLFFISYVIKLNKDIGQAEANLIASANVLDVTELIQTKLLVTPENLSKDLTWTKAGFSEAGWKQVSIPQHSIVQESEFKAGNFAYYRIHIPKETLIAKNLKDFQKEIFLALQYIQFYSFDIYINGTFFTSTTPATYDESIVNIPLAANNDNIVAIHGKIKDGDFGINHRGKILIGKGAELNELHRYAYKSGTVLPLIYILCKGSVFLIFTLIFMVMKVEKFFEKFLFYGFFVMAEDILTGDFIPTSVSLNTQVYLYNVVNIGIIVSLFLFLSDVLGKSYKKSTIAKLVVCLSLISFGMSVDLLHTSYIFNITHLLQGWNIALLLVLIYFIPKLLKNDKVLFATISLSLVLVTWSTFFSANVGFNLKAMANLLLFFMVAYQNFVLFRRNQNQLLEQEKDVAIGKTAALLAHDVRRPLEQMSLILNRISAGDSSAEFLRTARRDVDFSITSVGNQINDIMNFSRSKEINLEPISFYKVLSGAIKQVLTINKNVTLKINYDFKATERILGDESRLSSVLTNLISNSVEAIRDIGGKKEGVLKFSTQLVDKNIVFKIFNDGPQIPAEIIKDIFKPLFTHGKNHGTGLGLASVQKIMKEHQGEITVKNIEPTGVEFTLVFKIANSHDQILMEDFMTNSEAYKYEKVEMSPQATQRNLRIFLFDDDSQVYEYFQFIVKNLDFDVELVFASELDKARELVKSKRFDLYILDYDLGERTTGVDFYKENLSFLSSEVVLHSNRDKAILNNEKFLYQSKPISMDAFSKVCEDAYKLRLKILLVDDSELTLMAWEMFHGKHNITTAGSPEEALGILASGTHFDLCVLDYYYDNSSMNGSELALKVRELKTDLKIVIASNAQIEHEEVGCIAKNAFEVRGL